MFEALNSDSDLLKKFITLRAGAHRLSLAASQDLFSSHKIDHGTLLLLKRILEAKSGEISIVGDLGCGYGALGLGLSAAWSAAAVLWDRDALARDISALNATRNGLTEITTCGGLDYSLDASTPAFDLVVSNVPGKAPRTFHDFVVSEASAHIRRDGLLGVVVVRPLAALYRELFAAAPALEVISESGDERHSVQIARVVETTPTRRDGFTIGVYDRSSVHVPASRSLTTRTVFGLPEFDTLSYASGLGLELLRELPRNLSSCAGIGVGQGQLVVAAAARMSTCEQITLIDRDLLALKTASRALAENSLPTPVTLHHVAPTQPIGSDLVIMNVAEKASWGLTRIAFDRLMSLWSVDGGTIVVTGPSTDVTRLSQGFSIYGLSERKRARKKGFSAVVARRSL